VRARMINSFGGGERMMREKMAGPASPFMLHYIKWSIFIDQIIIAISDKPPNQLTSNTCLTNHFLPRTRD
jgi:hypothetical protein